MGFLRTVWLCRSTIVLVLAPILLLPVPLVYPVKAGRCAYAILLMAVYWMTEALPMAATALLPIVLMPWLGVAGSKQISVNYFKDTNMLFFGGLMVAVAVEKWNLHKRIALRVLMVVGSRPKWLMFGFMSTTAFLSMWISNTSTTAMMVPIAHAVLTELRQHQCSQEGAADGEDTTDSIVVEETKGGHMVIRVSVNDGDVSNAVAEPVTNGNKIDLSSTQMLNSNTRQARKIREEKFDVTSKGITLCVAYAANIGGTATLTGTPANLVLKGQLDAMFGTEAGVNFSSWFVFAFPNMVIILVLSWCWLQLYFLGPRELFSFCFKQARKTDNSACVVIRKEYDKLGPMSFAEIAVLIHFICLAILWITREPGFTAGWTDLGIFEPGYITDASLAITIAVSLFMFPSRRPNYFCFRKKGELSEPTPAPGLLDWETVHAKMSWSVVFILGGGFALADSCTSSGLSKVIANAFINFHDFPSWVLVLVLCTITAVFTEITSNVATATIFMPILVELASAIQINPLYLMIPVTISTSFAFMLPVATPPNAIVFAFGSLKIMDMVRAGVVMNIVCLAVLQIAINTWGLAYFNLNLVPSWLDQAAAAAAAVNVTMAPLLNTTVT